MNDFTMFRGYESLISDLNHFCKDIRVTPESDIILHGLKHATVDPRNGVPESKYFDTNNIINLTLVKGREYRIIKVIDRDTKSNLYYFYKPNTWFLKVEPLFGDEFSDNTLTEYLK